MQNSFIYKIIASSWNFIPKPIQESIKVCVFFAFIWGAIYLGTEYVVRRTIEGDWFVDAALKKINQNVIGQTYQAYFYLGRKNDPSEYSLQIYSSDKQKVELFLKVRHYEQGPLRKAEILINGNPVKGTNIAGSTEYKKSIDLTENVAEARSRGEHDFSKNIQTITFRVDPKQQTKSYILLEALVTTVGISKRYDMEAEE